MSSGIEPTISISRESHFYHSSTLAQVFVEISCIYVWTSTALKDWLYFPTIKIRPVVNEKQLSGSQIRISIRITPNFELGLPMIITSLLTKLHQNPTDIFREILLTNKQTNKHTNRHTKVIAISRFSRDNQPLPLITLLRSVRVKPTVNSHIFSQRSSKKLSTEAFRFLRCQRWCSHQWQILVCPVDLLPVYDFDCCWSWNRWCCWVK